MIAGDGDHPWVFYRDEVDLLEDQIEDLFERHDVPLNGTLTMEQEVLQEQLQTEETFEQSLAKVFEKDVLLLGSSITFSDPDQREEPDEVLFSRFRKEVNQQPLYQHARVWATKVHAFAHQRYEHDNIHSREMFCVYANVNLVPIKLSAALLEELRGDVLGIDVAIQEYKLASIYLGRVADSLEHVIGQELDSGPVIEMVGIARQLLGGLAARIDELEKRKNTQGTYGAA